MTDRPLVFLGTPEPAATILESLLHDGRNVVRVVTGPDKRRGRGSRTSPTPVKVVADRHGIPVDHDLTWFDGDVPASTLGIVVAYGKIVPARILAKVPMWNVHFSLLPRWRGAAPVARAILAGDETTGVCVMEMEEGLDTGGVLASRTIPILNVDTTESLTTRLAQAGALLIAEVIDGPVRSASPQHGSPVYARKIEPREALIDWSQPAVQIGRQVRALRAYTESEGTRLRVVEVDVVSADTRPDGETGVVNPDLTVSTGDGVIRLVRVQPEGKAVQAAAEWAKGWRSRDRRFDSPVAT